MPDTTDIALMLLEANRFRLQCRIDSLLERHNGDKQAATTSAGIGISFGFACELVTMCDRAATEIDWLTKGADQLSEDLAAIGDENTKLHAENEAFMANVDRLVDAIRSIRRITAKSYPERPYTALSEIDQIARRGLAG